MEIFDLENFPTPWRPIFKSSNCEVFSVRDQRDGNEYALKVITFNDFKEIDTHYTEALLHVKAMPHKNIVKMIGRRVEQEKHPQTE
jgi:hypothetical protein